MMTKCCQKTGKTPITLKWVDVNKGYEANKRYRSRLVVREIKINGHRILPDHELFSSMPPPEAAKTLASMLATKLQSNQNDAVEVEAV